MGKLTQARLERLTDFSAELQKQASARWVLSLAVGNGGGLLAVAAQMLGKEATEASLALLMPTAWAFALGIVLAGLLPAFSAMRFAYDHSYWLKKETFAARGEKAPYDPDEKVHDQIVEGLGWFELAMGAVSAVLFVIGLIYPLVVLSIRYHTAGGFLG